MGVDSKVPSQLVAQILLHLFSIPSKGGDVMPYRTECPGQCWRLHAARDSARIIRISGSGILLQITFDTSSVGQAAVLDGLVKQVGPFPVTGGTTTRRSPVYKQAAIWLAVAVISQ